MTYNYQRFKLAHFNESPLLLGNVWNVQSARVYERLGFAAIGTSSAAVAHSLGYEDGEQIPFETYLSIIERIIKSVDLPLTVDLEAGYGKNPEQILDNVKKLHALGVAGINLEDSSVINGERVLKSSFVFSEILGQLSLKLKELNMAIFLNVRSDVFLMGLPHALKEAKDRVKRYEKAGADGIFLPCISKKEDIVEITKTTSLPLNVMCVPELQDFRTLRDWGVKRISMGNFVNQKVYEHMNQLVSKVIADHSFQPLL